VENALTHGWGSFRSSDVEWGMPPLWQMRGEGCRKAGVPHFSPVLREVGVHEHVTNASPAGEINAEAILKYSTKRNKSFGANARISMLPVLPAHFSQNRGESMS
jgi:hypothetical protein